MNCARRSPRFAVRSGLILGALSQSLPTKVRELLEIAQSNCERLVLLVNDILDIEKVSAGQMRFDMHDRVTRRRHAPGGRGQRGLRAQVPGAHRARALGCGLQVSVDPDRFIQVMTNLLSNAVKYSPASGNRPCSGRTAGDSVRINVRDSGPGIPESFRAHIFERFSQADASTTREKGGTGLGLYIARRFIEQMQGRIGFESETARERPSGWNCRWWRATSNDCLSPGISNRGLPASPPRPGITLRQCKNGHHLLARRAPAGAHMRLPSL